MSIVIIVFSLVFLFCTYCAYRLYTSNEDIKRKSLPFKESMDLISLPIVTFVNNNVKLHFLLDTGSDDSYINSDIVQSLKVDKKIKAERAIITGNGEIKSEGRVVMDIVYKNMAYTNMFIISDMGPAFDLIAQDRGIKVHGILGNNFFNVYNYIIDFKDMIAYSKK